MYWYWYVRFSDDLLFYILSIVFLCREYALRKTKDTFRSHAGESNPDTIQKLLQDGEKNLIMLQRQVS